LDISAAGGQCCRLSAIPRVRDCPVALLLLLYCGYMLEVRVQGTVLIANSNNINIPIYFSSV